MRERRELRQRQVAARIDRGELRWIRPDSPRPDESDSRASLLAQRLPPPGRLVRIAPEIRDLSWNRRQRRVERQRQAQQRALIIEIGQGAPGGNQLRHPFEAGEHADERSRGLQDDSCSQIRHPLRVAAEHERVAQSLLAVHENRLARDRFPPQPGRLRKFSSFLVSRAFFISPAPLVFASIQVSRSPLSKNSSARPKWAAAKSGMSEIARS